MDLFGDDRFFVREPRRMRELMALDDKVRAWSKEEDAPSKTAVWTEQEVLEALQEELGEHMVPWPTESVWSEEGIKVLGDPMGTLVYEEEHYAGLRQSACQLGKTVSKLPAAQLRQTALYFCMGSKAGTSPGRGRPRRCKNSMRSGRGSS